MYKVRKNSVPWSTRTWSHTPCFSTVVLTSKKHVQIKSWSKQGFLTDSHHGTLQVDQVSSANRNVFMRNLFHVTPLTGYLLVNFLIDCNVVLYRHNRESGDIWTVSINGNYFRHAISCQFFILIQVDLMSEILSEVRNWIEQSRSAHLSLAVVVTRNPLKRCCHTIYPNA